MGCKGCKRKLVGFLRFKKAHDCTLLSLPRYNGSLIRLVRLLFSWPAERPVRQAISFMTLDRDTVWLLLFGGCRLSCKKNSGKGCICFARLYSLSSRSHDQTGRFS